MPTISIRYDIVSLIQHHAGVTITGKATVRGVLEIHSDCPFCPGSRDSFIMCPETGWASHSIRSSGCDWHGDGIDFLVDYCGMERWQAIEELGLEHVSFYTAKPEPKRTKYDPPPKQWQETGRNFVERAARYLWTSHAAEALAYLRGRGLSDETIMRRKFGYCPLQGDGRWYGTKPEEGGLEHWGLKAEDVQPAIAERGTVLIPPGIVIPWFEQDTLWKIAVRRLDEPNPDRRYRDIAGSAHGLYNLDSVQTGKPCMVVESEFCAASVEQEAGDLVSVVATGSADKGRNPHFVPLLSLPSCLIQSFDNDEPDEQGKRPGDAGAQYWLCLYDHCFRYRPLLKDPNDMLQVGGGEFIRDWVKSALDRWEGLKHPNVTPTLARARWNKVSPTVQREVERLSISEHVQTSQGLGTIWNTITLHEQIQEGKILVLLDKGILGLFLPGQLEPLARVS